MFPLMSGIPTENGNLCPKHVGVLIISSRVRD
jgi:hypothetical protein